ncbi:MAG: hypothetical protein NWQ46_09070 [Spirosomaceae bacterium]|nr:hypothetical protein [Spirosomataceae bacterium]
MSSLTIENTGEEMLIRFNRNTFDNGYLLSLLKRLEIESTAQNAQFSVEIGQLADEIDSDWWEKNKDSFLKGVSRK